MNSQAPRNRGLIHCRILLMILAISASTGCSLREKLPAWTQTPDQEGNLLIKYVVRDAASELDPWSSFADRGLEAAGWSNDRDSSNDLLKSAALHIEYPHPEQGAAFALATLTVYDRPLNEQQFAAKPKTHWYDRFRFGSFSKEPATTTPAPDEIVTLQIPRTQFELLMNEMSQEHYLDENSSSLGRLPKALLSITRNQKAILESSIEAPRLNEVIQHVYRDGDVILGGKRFSAPSILQTSAFVEAPNPTVVN